MLLPTPLHVKRGDIEPDITIKQQPVSSSNDKKDRLFCAYCHFLLTDSSEAISCSGSHTHTFTNPAGFVYTVDCYEHVPGCSGNGCPTAEHSWFGGYRWQLALCRSCQRHLGWRFINSTSFYVLIQGRYTRLS